MKLDGISFCINHRPKVKVTVSTQASYCQVGVGTHLIVFLVGGTYLQHVEVKIVREGVELGRHKTRHFCWTEYVPLWGVAVW